MVYGENMHYIITGVAGFIGSTLADKLLSIGHQVTGIDNFSTGRHTFLNKAKQHEHFTLIEGDLLDTKALSKAFATGEQVIHLSANADVRFGVEHPSKDFEQNAIATHNVLEAMRLNNIKRIAFASTGSVYGEASIIPTPEDAPFPIQTSLYAASKLSGEGFIEAYCESFDFIGHIFRFVSILGPRYTHGHVFDFCNQLRKDPSKLTVLGNGTQRKSYLHVDDCIDAMLLAIEKAPTDTKVHIYNLGVDSYCTVKDSIGWICSSLGVTPTIQFGEGDRGWIGDNPFIYLATEKIRSLGWTPKYTIEKSVKTTVSWLMENTWVFDNKEK